MKERRIFGLAFMGVLIAVPALADAPPKQYLGFDSHSPTIEDQYTGLVWQRTATPSVILGADPKTACPAPSRLPTIKELLTLVDEQPHKEYIGQSEQTFYIDISAFGGIDTERNRITPTAAFWSQTPSPSGSSQYWTLDFTTGMIQTSPTNVPLNVRCVTDKSP
jgi:hypothetical protein